MRNLHVYHVNQEVSEYYEWVESLRVYKNISKYEGYKWKRNSYDYRELIHSQDKDRDGLYGYYINW